MRACLLRGGEVLEYTANVANLTNVANLKLLVGAHKDFFGEKRVAPTGVCAYGRSAADGLRRWTTNSTLTAMLPR